MDIVVGMGNPKIVQASNFKTSCRHFSLSGKKSWQDDFFNSLAQQPYMFVKLEVSKTSRHKTPHTPSFDVLVLSFASHSF